MDFEYNDFSTYVDVMAAGKIPPEDELMHRGSTRFGSFVQSITQSGYVLVDSGTCRRYLKQSMPPLGFEYSKPKIHKKIAKLDEESQSGAPLGVDASRYHWVDLDGEGLPGILTKQGTARHYKPNRGGGKFGKMQTLRTQPSLFSGPGGEQLLDLDGNGTLDLVSFTGPVPGYYERSDDGQGWNCFKSFGELPHVRWDDRNVRFVDLDGDGQAEIMITQFDTIVWHPSRGKDGIGPGERVMCPGIKEDRGPRVVFADLYDSMTLGGYDGGWFG